jgi:Fur family ferric uptake transcriptional regulator
VTGVDDWVRRCAESWHDGRFVLVQQTNAYAVPPESQWRGYRPPQEPPGPDVEELHRRAQHLDARISIATVYRTVRLFEDKGILNRRDFGSGRARYEPNDHGQHHHLINVETGNVIEFQSTEHEQLMRAVAQQLGFELVSLRLELFGKPLAEGRRARLAGRAASQQGSAQTVGQMISKRR